eukprot:augustus_masked-scaffold_19-processed-gene-0.28-mRNA-1 protein AED:1.00 eAED:1.00 QI:0/-1/0/0/-1/1/1/0/195
MVHRAIIAGLKGLWARRGVSQDTLKWTAITSPHLFPSRVSPLDLDFNLHMNNASTLYQTELARWHLLSQNGLVHQILRNRWMIVLAGANIKFKREFKPMSKFVIETTINGYTDEWFYLTHLFLVNGQVSCVVSIRGCVLDSKKKKMNAKKLFEGIGLSSEEAAMIELNGDEDLWKGFLQWDNQAYKMLKDREQKI